MSNLRASPAFNQGLGGLRYQMPFLAAQLPVSDSLTPNLIPDDAAGSHHRQHLVPPGHRIHQCPVGSGQRRKLRLFQNWFQVPIQDLINGYTFEDATNPSGPAINDPAFGFGDSSNPFLGGTIGDGDAMPWNGHTYVLNLFQPFQNYWEHLLDDPAADGDIPGTGIQIPTFEEFGRALQAVAASSVAAFNPYTRVARRARPSATFPRA